MQPRTRRIVYALLYEAGAIAVVAPVLSLVFDRSMVSTVSLAVFMSGVALAWNYLFNSLFERWEKRQSVKGRSFKRRIAHGLGFEGGLVILLVPVVAVWLQISLLAALLADLAVLVFFFVYSVAFTWMFDRIFGLPLSATSCVKPPDRNRFAKTFE